MTDRSSSGFKSLIGRQNESQSPLAQCLATPSHFRLQGILATARERIEAACRGRRQARQRAIREVDCSRSISWWSAGGHHWPTGFERTVLFALDEDPTVITQRSRRTIEV